MTARSTPPRVRRGMERKFIPIATQATDAEVGELLELWRDLAGRPRWRRARGTLARLLTTRTEDL